MTDERNKLTARWEDGVEHDPRSEEIFKGIAEIDFKEGGDFFCFKSGGDGDNGEHLMYLLDEYFDRLDGTAEITDIGEDFVEFRTKPDGEIVPGIYRRAAEFLKAAGREQTHIEGNNDLEFIRFFFKPDLSMEEAETVGAKFGWD